MRSRNLESVPTFGVLITEFLAGIFSLIIIFSQLFWDGSFPKLNEIRFVEACLA